MIYSTIQNNNRPIQLNGRTNLTNGRRSLNNIQRRVTFADQMHQKNNKQVTQSAHKQIQLINVVRKIYQHVLSYVSNTESVYRTSSPHLQTFQHVQPRQSLPSNSFISHETNSRLHSTGKRRLKIFPQKFEQSKEQAVITQAPAIQQKHIQTHAQVIQLKSEIQKLRSQIRILSQNISRQNTSSDITSQSQVHKHQVERTRRLSQLNEFNQKLYSQLALKLKQISQKQYENYIQHEQSNTKLLDGMLESAAKAKAYEDQWENKKKHSVNQNFIDIKQFQQQYQQKYYSTGDTDYLHHHHQYDFIPLNPPSISDNVIGSPFLLYENQLKKNAQNSQAFTFHKQGLTNHQRHFRKSRSRVDNYQLFTLDGNRRETPENRVQKSPSFEVITVNKTKNIQNLTATKAQKQIEDFNRQLEGKILRKRFNSQYTTINKKKIYS